MQQPVQQAVLQQQLGGMAPQQQPQPQVNHPVQLSANTQPPTQPNPTQPTPQPPSPQQVSSQFTEKYYQIRTQRPELLVKFYGHNSKVTLDDGTGTKVFTGPQEISQGSNIFADARVIPHSINCTDIPGAQGGRGGYMLQVCGTVQRKGVNVQKFAQSFFLVHADQTQNHLVVSNDMITLFPQEQQQPPYQLVHPYMPQNSAAMLAMQQQNFMAAQQQTMMQQQPTQQQAGGGGGYGQAPARMDPVMPTNQENNAPSNIAFQQQQPQMQVMRTYHPSPHMPTTHPSSQMSPRPPMSAMKQGGQHIQQQQQQQQPIPIQAQQQQQQQQQYLPNSQSPHPQNQPMQQQHPHPMTQNPIYQQHPMQQQQQQQQQSQQQQQPDNITLPGSTQPLYQPTGKYVTQSETQTEDQVNSFHTVTSTSASDGQEMQGEGKGLAGGDQSRPPIKPPTIQNQNHTQFPSKTQPAVIPRPKEQIISQNTPQNQGRVRRPSRGTSVDGSTSSSPQPGGVGAQSNGNGVVEVSAINHTSAPIGQRPGRGFGGGGGYGGLGSAPVYSLIAQNLPQDISETRVKEIFSNYGQVRGLKIRPSMDKQDGHSDKCYAFVDFGSEQEMRAAVAGCDGQQVDGREISVAEKRPKINSYTKSGPYRGEGGGRGSSGYRESSRGGGRGGDLGRGRGRGTMDFMQRGRGRGRGDDRGGRGGGRSYRSSTPTQRS